MVKGNSNKRTGYLTRMGALVALLLLFELTGIGYIKTAGLEFTIMQVPVIVGAIILGPSAGAILGGVFGLTSFWECLSGKSAFGAALLSINPFYTFIVAVIARILMGWLCGLIFKALNSVDRTRFFSFAAASLSGALLNTLFFMFFLMILFGNTQFIRGFQGSLGVIPFVLAFVGVQGLLEALICFGAGTVLSKALHHFIPMK